MTSLPGPRADGRLPPLATPTRYALDLVVDPARPRFSGRARIQLGIAERTSWLVLHAHALDVTEATLVVGSETYRGKATMRAAEGAKTPEELVLGFDRPVPPGEAVLQLAYEAPFDGELSGFYRVKDGDRYYVFSQLESTDARRAFPCFDEPAFKTPFDIAVTVPRGQNAVSNAAEASREETERGTRITFATTKPLPTYLVALAAGDLEIRTAPAREHPAIRLITTRGKGPLGDLAMEATSGLVDVIARYLMVPYPYDKLDIVAVPELAAGAMENAGLVTFREEILLLDAARASQTARRRQAVTIAHELAHQWFGDLVTAAWWTDVWLNEGMATWMESRALETYRPAWNTRVDAVASALAVMDQDSLASARAVRQPVTSTEGAQEAFDAITYEKGAAVLGNIERWVGEDAFRRALSTYLQENAHTSVVSPALFTALDRASGKDVTAMASSYLDHPGVPEVTGDLACEASGRWSMQLNQERFRPLGSAIAEASDHTWLVPVCVQAQGDKEPRCVELTQGAPSLVAARGACPTWLFPNVRSGYYRFSLSDPETVKLAKARPKLDAAARVSILSNAWAAVRSGRLKPATILDVVSAFDDDETRHVVEQVIDVLRAASTSLVDDDARAAFRRVAAARLQKRKKSVGWEPAKDEEAGGERALVRRLVLSAMGNLAEDEATLREADVIAQRWLAGETDAIDADVAAVALDLASRHAGPSRVAELRAAAKKAKTREHRMTALKALAGFDDPKVLEEALDVSLTEDVQANELYYTVGSAIGRRAARATTETWIRRRWDDLRKKLPGSLGRLLVQAAGTGCTKEKVAELSAFYRPRAAEIEGAKRPVEHAIEESTLCAALHDGGAASFGRALRGEKEPKPARR